MSNIRISELDPVAATKLLIEGVFPFSQKNVSNNNEVTTYKATFQQLLDLFTALNSITYILPSGLIMPYGGTDTAFNLIKPLNGWKICNGDEISKAEYSALFAVIGNTYRGASTNSTLFKLPDLRGRTLIGSGQGPSLPSYSLGIEGGTETVILNINQIPAHTHTYDRGFSNKMFQSGTNQSALDPQGVPNPLSNSGSTGSNLPHNNMQPYTVINYIIKT